MARFLVTGGCGFIGSHLCAALLARGDEVRVLDDLSTGRIANLAPGAGLHVGDVGDPIVLRRALAGMDACFHLAAIASVERGVHDWTGTHRTNLSASIGVFDAARAGRLPVVYASSAAVYGAGGDDAIAETAPTRPLSAYGADKLGCEQHAMVAGHVHGVPTAGLRFFNVFGPRQDPASPYSGVISIFGDRLRRDEVLDIFGDGLQTRDFVYVGDVVAALLSAMRWAHLGAPVFNVCTGRATTVLDLAHLLADLSGVAPRLRHAPARLGEIRHSVGAPQTARSLLGLPEPMALRDALGLTLGWLRAGQPGLAPGAVASNRRRNVRAAT